MKIKGNGRAKILTQAELERLFTRGFLTPRDKLLFAIAYYCACRVSEVLALTAEDLAGSVVTLRKCTTKGKIATRTLPEHPKLQAYLAAYDPPSGLLFPGRSKDKPLTRAAADLILRAACRRARIRGASTHSFRRTALTNMSNANVPIRVIQEISGHKSLTALQRYLEVKPDQVESAISLLV
ncbi:MAG: Tyrosine recombinase XerC [Chroococcidiopsis cubana SAG 39.79]|uniref:Integrase n=1 Tax=Chroococcidiopsis cubana SAG 39.79 TaxID=388085 RepID=A0AB37URK6_9CYAN|nr:site-specific integrase [Chroococcidiopsis cubana]MDZ4877731.1 Tyrosine recombinase XerC [Chroococcidiopsis cubana SAG 39.79]PSB65878.1 integrase [Chroococcidiopsis cubana CCALA 043]RUT14018.1 integrase [Chroococcidiopsis cubana SAG 39.79]